MKNLLAFFRLDGPSALPLKKVLLENALATVGKRDGKMWMVEASLRLHGMQRCSTHVYWKYLLTICGCQPPSYTRARSPLNDPEWKTVPWTYIAKTPKDLLTDIFVEIPSLLADLDELRTAEDAYMKGEALMEMLAPRKAVARMAKEI
ncbi:hypothetical protein BDW71DRAFT_211954 [Aspergillus fruticulosus]